MGFLDRLRGRGSGSSSPSLGDDGAGIPGLEHLERFTATHRGVEAYVEPRTTVTEMTVALVAHDGEWTRRRIPDERAAFDLGRSLNIPVYDVAATGYPPRMRAWNRKKSLADKAAKAARAGLPRNPPPTST